MKDDVTLINEVMDRIPNKYMAMIVAAKRAKALNQGARPLVKIDVEKPTTLALYEIAGGFVEPGFDKVDKEILIIKSDSGENIPSPEILIDEIEEIEDDVEVEADDDVIAEDEEEIDDEDVDIDDPDEDIDLDDLDEDDDKNEVL